jgi:hypothetical protein
MGDRIVITFRKVDNNSIEELPGNHLKVIVGEKK